MKDSIVFSPNPMKEMRKYVAEAFGSFWLVFAGCGSAVLASAFPEVGIGFVGVSLALPRREKRTPGSPSGPFRPSPGARPRPSALPWLPRSSPSMGDVESKAPEENPFEIRVNTEKGWIAPNEVRAELMADVPASTEAADTEDAPSPKVLRFTLTFNREAVAITPPAEGEEDVLVANEAPVLEIMLRPVRDAREDRLVVRYPPLRGLTLVEATLQVSVTGLAPSRIENDEGALDPKKPFEPFGTEPIVGSRFLIGHGELCKRPDSLAFDIEWMGLPEDMKTWYGNYGVELDNASFKVDVALMDRGVPVPLGEGALFRESDGKLDSRPGIAIDDVAAAAASERLGYL